MSDLFAPFSGAIVMAWMPESEHACEPGPKFRPVLLLAEERRRDGTMEVLVAYGTSQQTARQSLGEFVIQKREAAFLAKDTKFQLRKRMWLPLTEELFTREGQVWILGSVPGSSIPRLFRAAEEAGLA